MSGHVPWLVGLALAVTATAAVINTFAPTHRPRLRRLVGLLALYALLAAAQAALTAAGLPAWSRRIELAAEIAGACTGVTVAATMVFGAALPRLRLALPMIVGDLAVGLGCVVATLGVLSNHDVDARGVLATSAVISALLAISLQSTFGNVIGGVALQLDGSVHEGDWLELPGGKQGRVRAVRWRHTVVETRDQSTIIVPNASLLQGNITILGKRGGAPAPQRMWVWFNVDFSYSPTEIIDVVSEALRSSAIENVAATPAPNVVCMDFTKERRESFATYAARYFIEDLTADDPTNSRVRARIYTALNRAGIPLAVPTTTALVKMDDAARKQRKGEKELSKRMRALEDVSMFGALTEEETERLAHAMSPVMYAAGERVTRQGATAHYLYLITEGTVEIRTTAEGASESVRVATLEAPDCFGEMALLTGEPRVADVLSLSPVRGYRLGREPFEALLHKRPPLADAVSKLLAERRVAFLSARENLDPMSQKERTESEQERILRSLKGFFGM